MIWCAGSGIGDSAACAGIVHRNHDIRAMRPASAVAGKAVNQSIFKRYGSQTEPAVFTCGIPG